MAEAIGLGASVIAFIGLAGQIIQGCQYVRTVLDDVKYASDDIGSLRTEITLLSRILESHKKLLTQLSSISGYEEVGAETKLALDYCEELMAALLKSISKVKKAGTSWGQIQFAFSKDKISNHINRVERAKGYISTAQASILLSFESRRAIDSNSTQQSLSSLHSDLKTSSTIISSLPSRLEQTDQNTLQIHRLVKEIGSDLASRIIDLSSGLNKILSSDLSPSMNILSQTRNQLRKETNNIRKVSFLMESIEGESSKMLKRLPINMLQVVEDTIRGSLAEFQIETAQLQGVSGMADGQSPMHSENHMTVSTGLGRQSSRKIQRYHTNSRRYLRAIGIITIHSITTTFSDRDTRNGTSSTSTITQTHVELFPNPEFIYMGVYCFFVQQGFATFPETIEPNIRVYHVVDSSTPIIRACANGDLQTVQSLFASGEASPFDRMWRDTSLLDLVMFRILMAATGRIPEAQLPKLMTLFKELVGFGLDPGLVKKIDCFSSDSLLPLLTIMKLTATCPKNMTRYLVELGRIIINKSVQDPLLSSENTNSETQTIPPSPISLEIFSILLTQENWPIAFESVSVDSIVQCITTGEPLTSYVVYQGSRLFGTAASINSIDPDKGILLSTLERLSLDEKIQVMGNIQLGPVFGIDNVTQLSQEETEEENIDYIVDRLFLCMESCIESGMEPHEPPLKVYKIIDNFLKHNKGDLLWSVLLDVGLEPDEIEDLFEADMYASLAYQLKHLSCHPCWKCRIPIKTLQDVMIRDELWSHYLKSLNRRASKLQTNSLLIDGQTVGDALKVMEDAVIEFMEQERKEAHYRQSRNTQTRSQQEDRIEVAGMSRESLAEDSDSSFNLYPLDLEVDGLVSRPLDCNSNLDGNTLDVPEAQATDKEHLNELVGERFLPLENGAPMASFSFSMRGAVSDTVPSQLELPETRERTEDISSMGPKNAHACYIDGDYDSDDGRIEGIAAALSAFWT